MSEMQALEVENSPSSEIDIDYEGKKSLDLNDSDDKLSLLSHQVTITSTEEKCSCQVESKACKTSYSETTFK